MFAGKLVRSRLGVGISLDTDGLPRPLARTCIGLCPLPTNGQSTLMAISPVALDRLQPLQIDANFASKVTLHDISAILNRGDNLGNLLFRKFLRPNIGGDPSRLKNREGINRADAIEVSERNGHFLVWGDVNPENSWHKFTLALTLLVTRVLADNPQDAISPDNLAVFTKLFD